jgi:hypothetical protein
MPAAGLPCAEYCVFEGVAGEGVAEEDVAEGGLAEEGVAGADWPTAAVHGRAHSPIHRMLIDRMEALFIFQ